MSLVYLNKRKDVQSFVDKRHLLPYLPIIKYKQSDDEESEWSNNRLGYKPRLFSKQSR